MSRSLSRATLVLVGLFSAYCAAISFSRGRKRFDPLGPDALPTLVGFLCLGLLVAIALRHLRPSENTEADDLPEPALPRAALLRACALFAMAVLFAAVLSGGGLPFRYVAPVFLGASMLLLHQGARSPRLVLGVIASALVLSFGLDFIFRVYLSVNLP